MNQRLEGSAVVDHETNGFRVDRKGKSLLEEALKVRPALVQLFGIELFYAWLKHQGLFRRNSIAPKPSLAQRRCERSLLGWTSVKLIYTSV